MIVDLHYNVPTTKTDTRLDIDYSCNEINGALNYTINVPHKEGEAELYLENSQYVSLEATYNVSDDFINPGTKLYLLYSG
jgi:hypothetical protein